MEVEKQAPPGKWEEVLEEAAKLLQASGAKLTDKIPYSQELCIVAVVSRRMKFRRFPYMYFITDGGRPGAEFYNLQVTTSSGSIHPVLSSHAGQVLSTVELLCTHLWIILESMNH